MKRIFVIGLLLLCVFAFADDAKVMPMMVGRLYVAPTYSFATGTYDTDGDFTSFDSGSVKVFNLGFALEYGVLNWLTAAVQWVPGWTPWSDVKAASGVSNTNANGVADLFAGLKIQLAGEKAPLRTGNFRFALAPGVIIPLPGPDFEKELTNAMTGSKATLSSMDNHVFGAGGRFYFDVLFNKHFFLNLYNETIIYPSKLDLNKNSPVFYGAKAQIAGAMQETLGPGAAYIMDINGKINYNYRLTFELEPVFTTPIASGIDLSVGLPINYRFIPAYSYSFDYPAAIAPYSEAIEPYLKGALDTDAHHTLSLIPNASIFIMKSFIPLEFKFQYAIPVYGRNTMARHNATLQIRAYFALPGRPE